MFAVGGHGDQDIPVRVQNVFRFEFSGVNTIRLLHQKLHPIAVQESEYVVCGNVPIACCRTPPSYLGVVFVNYPGGAWRETKAALSENDRLRKIRRRIADMMIEP